MLQRDFFMEQSSKWMLKNPSWIQEKKTNFDILTVAYLKFVNNAVIIFLTIFVFLYKRILLVFISYEL